MRPDRPEVADIFRVHEERFLEDYPTSAEQRKVLRAITACRTAALGGHVRQCDECEHLEISYNSCRNRHCPKCQCHNNAQWLETQAQNLLEVAYFHVVFTLPEALGPIALQNQKTVYAILFRAASETLLTVARDPKHLGAQIGFVAILHTWGQTLQHHPHLHCLVPAGGLSPDGQHWIASRPGFFLPVRVLSRLFRRKFLHYLQEAYRLGKLSWHGKLRHFSDPHLWSTFLEEFKKNDWVVYSKPPFGGSQQVLKYLARYTHRVALSNQRLLPSESNQVSFRWKDYRRQQRPCIMTLQATEFIRRFLLHVLPKGFMRIRHYGFLANRCRKQKLAGCRQLLGQTPSPETSANDLQTVDQEDPGPLCPVCQRGHLLLIETFETLPDWVHQQLGAKTHDTS
jgi:hypothetical protein